MVEEYQNLVKIVQEIESSSVKVELNSIDISSISSKQTELKKPIFKLLLDDAMAMEAAVLSEQQNKQRPVQARQVIQIQSTSRAQQTVPSNVSQQVQAAPVQAVQQPVNKIVEKPIQNIEEPKQAAKKELTKFADNLNQQEPPKINAFNVAPEPEEDLVLPSLSIPDQISELERIIEGIKEHVFDKKHMEIIKKEVYGLSQRVNQKRASTESSSMDEPLIILRNMRIDAVKALLSESNV